MCKEISLSQCSNGVRQFIESCYREQLSIVDLQLEEKEEEEGEKEETDLISTNL